MMEMTLRVTLGIEVEVERPNLDAARRRVRVVSAIPSFSRHQIKTYRCESLGSYSGKVGVTFRRSGEHVRW